MSFSIPLTPQAPINRMNPNSLNKTFATFSRALKKDRYIESIKAHFQLLPSYRRFPNNEEFRREIKTRDLYNFRSRSYWLRRLENKDRKERVLIDEYTIEHILPQNENLPREWQEALGSEWKQVQETWLHTLGNLTLTGYNSEYSDRPFIKKRDMKGGFRESPLRVNKGLGILESWNENTIKNRAEELAEEAIQVWNLPLLPGEVLNAYRKHPDEAQAYSIDDHSQLATEKPMRPLFEELRKELLSLDPCVTEEFLKLYIAYKAETNFLDIVPQASALRLSLNMKFHELQDPKSIAQDVTGLGRWGNGDVEIKLTSLEDIPYVMGLARQAFEKQMGNGENNL